MIVRVFYITLAFLSTLGAWAQITLLLRQTGEKGLMVGRKAWQ